MSGEGLVHRRNVNKVNSEANSNDIEERDDRRQNSNEDDPEDGDSKEARLTLMEEVLLLGLKDKEVRFFCVYFQ